MALSRQRILTYASDTYKLTALLFRNVIFTTNPTQPQPLAAYRAKTRQLLLDQSKPSATNITNASNVTNATDSVNLTAIKLLEWDREWSQLKYYGVKEYSRRWWNESRWSSSLSSSSSSSSWSSSWSSLVPRGLANWSSYSSSSSPLSSSTSSNSSQNQTQSNQSSNNSNQSNNSSNGKVARVAFMITSEDRQRLSLELGYTQQDIKSFTPTEAMLLLEHGVKRDMTIDMTGGSVEKKEEYDFRIKLKELMVENDRLMQLEQHQHMQHQQHQQQGNIETQNHLEIKGIQEISNGTKDNLSDLSPEQAQHLHAKPDVALALLSADKTTDHGGNFELDPSVNSLVEVKDDAASSAHSANGTESSEGSSNSSFESSATSEQSSVASSPEPETNASRKGKMEVTPHDSEKLAMKPDVAAVYLEAHQRRTSQSQTRTLSSEQSLDSSNSTNSSNSSDSSDSSFGDDEPCWYEVIERSRINSGNNMNSEQVVALFSTEKEARECARIKEAALLRREAGRGGRGGVATGGGVDGADGADGEGGVGGEGGGVDRFFVRRRKSS